MTPTPAIANVMKLDSVPAQPVDPAAPKPGVRSRLLRVIYAGSSAATWRGQATTATLCRIAEALPDNTITVRELIKLSGANGLLFLCAILNIPFLLPIPVPGLSTPFGVLIAFFGVGVMAGRVPWLPRFMMERQLPTKPIRAICARGIGLFRRIEWAIHPRFQLLTDGWIGRASGIAIIIAGIMLAAPLPIPGTNAPPALAGLLLALGLIERDGILLMVGYGVLIGTLALGKLFLLAALKSWAMFAGWWKG